jgi:hypothetical protein
LTTEVTIAQRGKNDFAGGFTKKSLFKVNVSGGRSVVYKYFRLRIAVQKFCISHSQYNIHTLGCAYHYG